VASSNVALSLITFAVLLNLKHFICEYVLQTQDIAVSKLRYGSINSFIHILHHAFGTLMAGLIVDFNLGLTLGLVVLESVIHYHIDWAHMRFGARSYRDKTYWQWLGAEQFAHHQTFIIMIILARYVLIS
jgi:Protein of unknown function (DUF3307)